MASSKLNIFSSLARHESDSEDEDNFQKTKAKKTTEKREGGNRTDDKTRDNKGGAQRTALGGNVPLKVEKEEHTRAKDTKKEKGVSGQAHPLDRHSGTNVHAYGNKEKKGGQGKGNWGKSGKEGEDAEEGETSPEVKLPVEEEKPSMTLQEYYEQHKAAQNQPQINESKAKITSEHLKKELGNSTLLKSKYQQEVDDRKGGKRKEKREDEHRAALTTEHGNLLNFRTGFIDKEYKKRDPEEAGQKRGPRTTGPRTDKREEGKEEEGAPQATTEGTEQTQGEVAQSPTAEGEGAQQDNQNRRGGRGGRGRGGRGGYRGEHHGEGGQRGGNRRYEGKQGGAQKPVVTDDAFPKLG